MKLFVENAEIQAQHTQLGIETLKLQGQVEKETFEVELVFIQMHHALPQVITDQ